MSDVFVVGIDRIPFGSFPNRTLPELGADAVLLALADCGLSVRELQALYCGNVGEASEMVGQRILRHVGQSGIPVVNSANGCATGATAFREAWTSVKAGLYDLVLAVGVEQVRVEEIGVNPTCGVPADRLSAEGLLGSYTPAAIFAEAGMEHTKKYGTTLEQFAKVAVKNHHHGTLNPKPSGRSRTSLEAVMQAETIAYPNTTLMAAEDADGAAAVVLCSERKTRELGLGGRAIRVAASVLTSDPWQERDLVMPNMNTCTRRAAAQAYEMASLAPEDLDLVELYDAFATAELLNYENLGLCRDGDAGRAIDEGDVALGGRVPVNVSGGLLSLGHPRGATGVAQLVELSTHLRGEAGKRQVEGARHGLAHVVGLGSACSIHVLAGPSG